MNFLNLMECHYSKFCVSDLVSDGLQSMDMLRNALDSGLPVKGFQAELGACK
jgi:hypothetical protein